MPILATAALAAVLPFQAPVDSPPGWQERELCALPEGTKLRSYGLPQVVFTDDGRAAAFVVEDSDRTALPVHAFPDRKGVVQLEIGRSHDVILMPALTDDGTSAAFTVADDLQTARESWRVLVDGKTKLKADHLGPPHFWPGTDELLVWTVPKGKFDEWNGVTGDHVLRRGKRSGDPWVSALLAGPILFSKDGSSALSYASGDEERGLLLVTPKKERLVPVPLTNSMGAGLLMALSADGKEWALEEQRVELRQTGSSSTAVVTQVVHTPNGLVGDGFSSVRLPRFAPAGKRLAVAAQDVETERWGGWIVDGRDPDHDFGRVTDIAWEPGDERKVGLAFSALEADVDDPMTVLRVMDREGRLLEGVTKWDRVRYLRVGPSGVAERDLIFTVPDGAGWRLVRERTVAGSVQMWQSEVYTYIAPPVVDGERIGAGAVKDGALVWLAME